MSIDYEKAQAIFLEALEQNDPAEQNRYVVEACGDDRELRQHLEALFDAHRQSGSFLEKGALTADPTIDQPITEKPGSRIGPYKLLQQIGEGGMGVVFMADQKEPVKRRVALKIIKPGMDTRQVIARFDAERQALAMMNHPNIATVLDCGTTEIGRPYFVMELVKGIPITKYCDEHRLTVEQRLKLFIPICHAVEHAHQKGVIHRDIKPSNVLVAEHDDHPVPKVIDFGLAKAVGFQLTQKSYFTEFGRILGTPHYMSPEQAKLNQLDIDTRSDIFSLGVLLYELLTGETPIDRKRLRSAAFDELLRIIREEDPPKPSKRLSSSGFLPEIAHRRKFDPDKLTGYVHGDLDIITIKALEKDRTRRYPTCTGLAKDVQLFLNRQPIEARPATSAYRLRRFYQRNQFAVLAVLTVACTLLAATILSVNLAIRATTAETIADNRADRLSSALETAEHLRIDAQQAAGREKDLRRKAQKLEREARWDAYVAGLHLMQEAWRENDTIRLEKLIRESTPKENEPDFRGWEWFYLNEQVRSATKLLQSEVGAVSWSPAKNTFFTSTFNGSEIQQWNADSLTTTRRFQLGMVIKYIDVSPGGTRIAVGGMHGELKVVDAQSGKLIWDNLALEQNSVSDVRAMAWSPDESQFACGTTDGRIAVVDMIGESVRQLRLNREYMCHSIKWHGIRDLLTIAYAPDGVAVLDVESGERLYENKWADAGALSPNGDMIVLAGGGWVMIRSTESNQWRMIRKIDGGHRGKVTELTWVDNARFASSGQDRRLCIWHVAGGEVLNAYRLGGNVNQIELDHSGNRLLTQSNPHESRISSVLKQKAFVRPIDAETLRVSHSIPAHVDILRRMQQGYLTWTPDGMQVTVDLDSLDALDEFRARVDGEPCAVDPSRKAVATRGYNHPEELDSEKWRFESDRRPKILLFDVDGGEMLLDYESKALPAWDATGTFLATGAFNGDVHIHSCEDYRKLVKLEGHNREVTGLCFSPDRRRLVTSSLDGTCRIWDLATGQELFQLTHEDSSFRAVSWSPDGSRVASVTEEGETVVWGSPLIRPASGSRDILETGFIAKEFNRLGHDLTLPKPSELVWTEHYPTLLALTKSDEACKKIDSHVEALLASPIGDKSNLRRSLIKILIHLSGQSISVSAQNCIEANLAQLLDAEISSNPDVLETYGDLLSAVAAFDTFQSRDTALFDAALEGLTRIIELDSVNVVALRHRAALLAECFHNPELAYKDERKALAANLERGFGRGDSFPPHYFKQRARLGIEYEQTREVLADYAQCKQQYPGYALDLPEEGIKRLFRIHARRNEWSTVAELLLLVSEAHPDQDSYPGHLAPTLVRLKRFDDYQRVCSDILERFKDPWRRRRAICSCLWFEDGNRDYRDLGDQLQAFPTGVWWRRAERPIFIGLAYLRDGAATEAIEWLEKMPPSAMAPYQVLVSAALSIAYADMGEYAKANDLLSQAKMKYAESVSPDDLGEEWPTWLKCQILIEEARDRLHTSDE